MKFSRLVCPFDSSVKAVLAEASLHSLYMEVHSMFH